VEEYLWMQHCLNLNRIIPAVKNKRGGFLFEIPFLFFLGFCFSGVLNGYALNYQTGQGFDANCFNAKMALIELDFNKCSNLLAEEKRNTPNNLLVHFLELKAEAISILIYENRGNLSKWKKDLKSFESRLKKQNFTGRENFGWKAELYLLQGFLNVRDENYFAAVTDFNYSYNTYKVAAKRYPEDLSIKLGVSLFDILIGIVPADYQWALKILGYQGNVSRGFNGLLSIVNNCNNKSQMFLKDEALFLYCILAGNFGDRSEELVNTIVENLDRAKQNPLLRYAFASAVLREKNATIALDILGDQPIQETLPHLFYLKGLLLLYAENQQSEKYFKLFLEKHHGDMLRAATYQKLSWYYYLKSNPELAKQFSLKIKEVNSFPTDEDLQAKNSAAKPFIAKCLLRARLDFDGGFFEKCLSQLLGCGKGELKTTSEHLEFLYRLGRVYQRTGNYLKAIYYFDLTIESGLNQKDYFAPAAALYAGVLEENKNKYESAGKYYNKVFEFKNYPYERSINQKAKAGLSRIRAKLGL